MNLEKQLYIEGSLDLTNCCINPQTGIIEFLKEVIHETGNKHISCRLSEESFWALIAHPLTSRGLLSSYSILTNTCTLLGVTVNVSDEYEDALVVLIDKVASHNKLTFLI